MATIDKLSVRAEFDKIKVGFDEQVKAGKVSVFVNKVVALSLKFYTANATPC